MHISAEDLNLMFSGKADAVTHAAWTDHILDCPTCATRFKAMNALSRELGPARPLRIPLRYALGVAAVMAMSIYPYLSQPTRSNPAVQTQLAHRSTAVDAEPLAEAPLSQLAQHESEPMASAPVKRQVAAAEIILEKPEDLSFSVLHQVARVNYKTSLSHWGQSADVTHLIAFSGDVR